MFLFFQLTPHTFDSLLLHSPSSVFIFMSWRLIIISGTPAVASTGNRTDNQTKHKTATDLQCRRSCSLRKYISSCTMFKYTILMYFDYLNFYLNDILYFILMRLFYTFAVCLIRMTISVLFSRFNSPTVFSSLHYEYSSAQKTHQCANNHNQNIYYIRENG